MNYMALTPSRMLPLGTVAPAFRLPDFDGKIISIEDFQNSPLLLVMFICNHCPYVKHIRNKLADLTKTYIQKDVAVVAINSNDMSQYPEDAPEKMRLETKEAG